MRTLILAALALLTTGVDARTHLKKPKRGFQMKVGTYTIQPAQDLEVCEYRRLPIRKPMDVSGFEVRMPAGAHHFVVWAYGGNLQDDSLFPHGPVPAFGCAGVSPDEAIPQVLIPIQTPNSRFHFPAGVALQVDAHEQVLLNPHMKNAEATPITPDIRFNFYAARKGTVEHRAQGLIVGNTSAIHIPAGGDQTLTAEWTAPVNMTLVYLATHQHRLGTYGNIEIVDPDGVTRSKVYENQDWQHPYSYWPAPPIRLAQNQKMRITCTWHNTDDHDVVFGPKTTDEMCFILGFYYRDDGDTTPVTGHGCIPAKRGLLCPLAPVVTE